MDEFIQAIEDYKAAKKHKAKCKEGTAAYDKASDAVYEACKRVEDVMDRYLIERLRKFGIEVNEA